MNTKKRKKRENNYSESQMPCYKKRIKKCYNQKIEVKRTGEERRIVWNCLNALQLTSSQGRRPFNSDKPFKDRLKVLYKIFFHGQCIRKHYWNHLPWKMRPAKSQARRVRLTYFLSIQVFSPAWNLFLARYVLFHVRCMKRYKLHQYLDSI